MKLVQACLCAGKISQSGFNLPRGFVKFVQVYFNVRKDLERIFLHSGRLVKLLQACLCA